MSLRHAPRGLKDLGWLAFQFREQLKNLVALRRIQTCKRLLARLETLGPKLV